MNKYDGINSINTNIHSKNKNLTSVNRNYLLIHIKLLEQAFNFTIVVNFNIHKSSMSW